MLPFKAPQGEPRPSMVGLSSLRSGRRHFQGGPEETAGREALPVLPFPLGLSRSIPRGLTQPGRPTDTAPHPPSGAEHRNTVTQSWPGGWAVGWSVLACHFPLCPQGCPSRSRLDLWQHSKGGLGDQSPGAGVGESVNPSLSRGILTALPESRSHAPSF